MQRSEKIVHKSMQDEIADLDKRLAQKSTYGVWPLCIGGAIALVVLYLCGALPVLPPL